MANLTDDDFFLNIKTAIESVRFMRRFKVDITLRNAENNDIIIEIRSTKAKIWLRINQADCPVSKFIFN